MRPFFICYFLLCSFVPGPYYPATFWRPACVGALLSCALLSVHLYRNGLIKNYTKFCRHHWSLWYFSEELVCWPLLYSKWMLYIIILYIIGIDYNYLAWTDNFAVRKAKIQPMEGKQKVTCILIAFFKKVFKVLNPKFCLKEKEDKNDSCKRYRSKKLCLAVLADNRFAISTSPSFQRNIE